MRQRRAMLIASVLAGLFASAIIAQQRAGVAQASDGAHVVEGDARAQAPALEGDDLPRARNAALVYWRAWELRPIGLQEKLDASFNGRDLEWSPEATVAEELVRAQGYVEVLLAGTRIEQCDWGIDYSNGRGLSVPHLEKLRAASRVLVADCRRLTDAGVIDQALARIEGLYALSRHGGSDRLVASSLVAQGFARMAADEVRRLHARGQLTRAHAQRLLPMVEHGLGPDAFGVGGAIAFEGRLTRRYLSRFKGVNAGREFFAAVQRGGEPDIYVQPILKMDDRALHAEGDRVREYFDRAAAAWEKPEALEELQALQEQVLAGDFGPLAVLVAPGFAEFREGANGHLEVFRETQAAVSGQLAK